MATVLSTLYPPLVSDFMPAFLTSEDATVQFSISAYNATNIINRLHVSLVYQYTNIKAIKNKNLPSSDGTGNNPVIINNIWIVDMNNNNYISYNQFTKMYTLTIPQDVLKTTPWSADGYYKLQLRFDESSSQITEDYLIEHRNRFSEWSSVCLLKAIPNVRIALSKFDIDDNTIDTPGFNAGVIPIIGEVIFENNLSGTKAETLRSYSITLYNKNNVEDILDESGEIYTAGQVDLNRIYWLASAENADPENKYVVKVNITTKNQYTTFKTYDLEIFNYNPTPFEVTWDFKRTHLEQYNITTDGKIITEEDGIVECTITTTSVMPPGYLYIKRASNLDNFKKWELISCTEHAEGVVTQTFADTTVGSLVRYQYSAQYQLTTEAFTRVVKSQDTVYPNFYDMLLSRDGRQLAIRYKEQISSLKPVVNRQKVDTLGGKYPKFVENAQMNYKQFSISGLIDAESDYNRKFLDDRNYLDAMSTYDREMNGKYEIRNDTVADNEYAYINTSDSRKISSHTNTVHDLYPKDNWWWEREFREEAIKWLNDGEPKLFRSMPEGNMVVMLTDISLTPEQTIGRRLYNFSATMYEIENGYSIETLESLGIITVVNEKENSSTDSGVIPIDTITKTTIGQMYSQELRVNNATPPSAVVINRQFNASMDDNNCGIKGFDYNHTNIGDWYNYIVYDKDSALGKKYMMVSDSIVLTDLQIQFESPPTWWRFDRDNIIDIDEDDPSNTDINATKALGYKIQLTLESGDKGKNKTVNVFVGEKGYYQTPSNLRIIGLNVYGNATATLNYKIEYQITYNTSDLPVNTKSQGNIVGQLYGMWTPNTHVAQELREKHKWNKTQEGKVILQEFLDTWTAVSLEMTPYTVFALKFAEDTYNTYVVGRTGIYNLVDDGEFNIEDLYFMGRRMVLVDKNIVNSITWNQLVALNMIATIDSIKGNTLLSNNKLLNVNIAGIGSKNSNNSILDRCFIDISTYFPEGMKAIGNTYDELTKNEATIRIGSRAYETGDEENNNVITDGITTYYKLITPVIIEFESPLDMYYSTKNGNIEFLIMDDTNSESQTAPVPMTITYTANVPPTSTIYKTMTGKKINISNKSGYIYDTNKPLDTLTIYGKSVQDGTPTPEAPVPISVVEPANILDRTPYRVGSGFYNPSPGTQIVAQSSDSDITVTDDGTVITLDASSTWKGVVFVSDALEVGKSYRFSHGAMAFTSQTSSFGRSYYTLDADHKVVRNLGNSNTLPTNAGGWTVTLESGEVYFAIGIGVRGTAASFTINNLWMNKGTTALPYTPHGYIGLQVGDTVTPINLQGNKLCSLPDGTRDELNIDSTGAVTLTKRTFMLEFDGSNMSGWSITTSGNHTFGQYLNANVASDDAVTLTANNSMCSSGVFAVIGTGTTNLGYSNTTRYLRFRPVDEPTIETLTTYLQSNPTRFVLPLKEPQTIDLGYIDMPPLTDGDIVYVAASIIPSIAIKQKILQETYTDDLATVSKTIEENVSTTFNQSITIPSGHKYIKIIDGTKTLNTSNGISFNAVSDTDQVFDLTLMFGEGNEPNTISEFEILYPLSNYSYEPGKIININSNKTFSLNEWEYVLDSSAIESDDIENNNWEDFTNNQASEIDLNLQENEENSLGQENLNRIWDNLTEEGEAPHSYTSNEQILWPKYNTVYGIKGDNDELVYKLYYVDGGWYDIDFMDESREIAIAKVPVHGMINYQGTVVQQTFSN